MAENHSKEQLQQEILEIQSLVQQLDQDGMDNKQVIQKLNNKCNQLNQKLEQSNAFSNSNHEVDYNELTEINSPMDDYTNLV